MTSPRDLAFIAGALSLTPGEEVLEIGPGLGALTEALLETGAHVIAVEKDASLAADLKERLKDRPFRLIQKDILSLRLAGEFTPEKPIKIAGNIPYNITSPILEWMISQRNLISEGVLTVQWEVAKRLTALPGGKDWGSLSFFLQYYADVELLRKIDKSHFYPAPKVDSGVVRLRFLGHGRFPVASEEHLFGCVRRSFQKRRKTLLNALGGGEPGEPSKEALSGVLTGLSIDPRRRAETLSILEWTKLSDSLGRMLK